MGLLEPITHKEEIESLLNEAQHKYDDATKRLEDQKSRTAKSLERLGEQKLEAWSGDMQNFLYVFNQFNHVQMVSKKGNLYQFAGKNEKPQELMINIERASMTATEVLKTGALAIGTGALVGIASYGGAMMFAHASTGTAIAALSGAAKTNATLAWFGGGSLASGGLGKLGGKLVLGGIVVAPILLVAGLITAAKSKENLAEAKKIHADAEKAVAQMNTLITGMEGIEKMSENYRDFLGKLSLLFQPFVDEMERISQDYAPGADGKIDFDSLSEMEQKTLHLSWLLAQLYYHGLSATILTDDGYVAPEAKTILAKSEKEYLSISGEVAKLNKEKEEIRQLLSSAQTTFNSAYKNYFDQKKSAQINLAAFGRKKLEICNEQIKKYVDCISVFEDIDITNTLHYGPFCEDTEAVFETVELAISATAATTGDTLPTSALVELGAFNGMAFLAEATQYENPARFLIDVDKHDLSLWFADEMDSYSNAQFEFAGMTGAQIEWAEEIINAITGKENLAQAKDIHTTINESARKMNAAANVSAEIGPRITKSLDCIKSVQKVLKPFVAELEAIAQQHGYAEASAIAFSELTEAEQKVVEMSWNIFKLQYYILSANSLAEPISSDVETLDRIVTEVNKELRALRKDAFKMSGAYTLAANLIWKPFAQKVMFINFAAMALFIVITCIQLAHKNWYGFVGIASTAVALPIFFYYKGLPQSKLFMWRIVRLVAAFLIFAGVQLLRLVG